MPDDPRTDRILDAIRAIPKGFVRAYSDVDPAAPRLVGRILATTDADVPWWRMVRADGSVPKGAHQLDLLRRERVPMRGARVDMPAARYPAAPPGPRPAAAPRRWSLPRAIAAVAAADPAMEALIARAGPIAHRPGNPDGHFGALVRSIVFQQLAGVAANAIHGRVRALVPGPLDAASLARASDADLRAAGLAGRSSRRCATCRRRSWTAPSRWTTRRRSPTRRSWRGSSRCAASAAGPPRCT